MKKQDLTGRVALVTGASSGIGVWASIAVAGSSPCPSDCRLQIERPDGSRLTVVLSAFDASKIATLCAQFLRSRYAMIQIVP